MSCKVEIVERKDPIVQLEASELSIKNFLSDLLNETEGFKYQITAEVLLKNTSAKILIRKFFSINFIHD